MTNKPHIIKMPLSVIVKYLSYGLLAGGVISLIAYIFLKQQYGVLDVSLVGFIIGGLIALNFLNNQYRGVYIIAGAFGTIGAAALIATHFENPFLIGFAPLGGLLAILTLILPENHF